MQNNNDKNTNNINQDNSNDSVNEAIEQQKLLKDTQAYYGENYIKIEGTGTKIDSIINTYFDYIEQGFDLSIEEILNYLQCSDSYFRINYRDSIKHIRITVMIRDIFFQMLRAEKFSLTDERVNFWISMFLKRILYNRNDFNRFIKENCFVEYKYKKLSLEDFGFYTEVFDERINIIDWLNYISYELYGRCKEGVLKPIEYMPTQLYSFKSIMKKYELKYDVEFYRLLNNNGVNKILLGNLVRYDIKDFKDSVNVIKINYKVWEDKGSKKVIKEILKVYNSLYKEKK